MEPLTTGPESKKDEGATMYLVAKETEKAGLSFCCLQEVKYRNSGKKLIRLDNGVSYEFQWCGMKKRREHTVHLTNWYLQKKMFPLFLKSRNIFLLPSGNN